MLGGSRGSTRGTSALKNQGSVQKTTTKLLQQRGRTLTPTASRTVKASFNLNQKKEEDEKSVFDEEKEEELLRLAAERKERAQKLRERQEKHLNKLKEKKQLEAQKEEEARLKKER